MGKKYTEKMKKGLAISGKKRYNNILRERLRKSVLEEVADLPNIKSAKKRVLVNKTKHDQNQMIKSALKTSIKKVEAAVAEGNREEANAAYTCAVKRIDQAASKHVLHKNTAARKKSALTLKLNGMA